MIFLDGASNDGQEMNNYPQVKCRLILISARVSPACKNKKN